MPAWDDPALEALDAARSLEGFGIELPQPAAEWVTKLAELRQQRPQPLPTHHVAGLIADSVDEAVIDRAVASHVGHHFRVQQHAQAERICGQRALAAILADRDRIHDELRTTAEALIDRLHRAAAIDEDIRELTRQRRVDEAHLLATADADTAELREAVRVRDYYLTPRTEHWSTGWWSCEHWRNPWEIDGSNADHDGTLWSVWRSRIRANGKLWFPTVEEAHAASQPHEPVDELIAPYKAFA
jgi:hypothetical protein